ncbi:hypothetical protein B9Z65_8428 [Elsinoe australis]|uniref:Uncharacterized protein n=1 Tax=Elsinoe australis TaxID=40998 RepID=A0A2P7YDQ7_9PEZI|nr:hypothetical protein B9Z65_8428 [Elsinoe australis]
MVFRPQHSLLELNMERVHTIDTRSVEDLFGLWKVFSKTTNALEDGKRLENMSWRLWNRETFCCSQTVKKVSRSSVSSAREVSTRKSSNIPKLPELATSLDTISSDDDAELEDLPDQSPPPHVVRPELTRLESSDSRTQKHISPGELEKIVVSIKQTTGVEPIEDLDLPALSGSPFAFGGKDRTVSSHSEPAQMEVAPDQQPTSTIQSQKIESSTSTVSTSDPDDSPTAAASSDSSSTAMSTHDVVRGFIPGGAPSSYRSQTQLATQPTPILKHSPRQMPSRPKQKGPMFTLGGSSGEEESSLESHLYKSSISSLSEGLHKHGVRKQASFRDDALVSKIQDSPVFESDDEDDDDDDDDVSEGVIEDDEDSSDWEDELGDEDRSDTEDSPLFQRVDSRPNLTSRRSLLTSAFHEGDRAKALQNAASRSTPAIRRTQTTPPESSSRAQSPARAMNGPEASGTGARPITMNANNLHPQLALSPRTTRRNMLSTELTESLRRNLLWERQHKSSQNVAALKRRHTSHDVKNLKQFPEPTPHMSAKENADKFTNDYFHAGLGEYHSKGW